MPEHIELRYSLNDPFIQTNNEFIYELAMNCEDPTDDLLISQINQWLRAMGRTNLEIKPITPTPQRS